MEILTHQSQKVQDFSKIETRTASPLVVLRREFLEGITQKAQAMELTLPKQVLFCASKLIDYLLHWRNWKVTHQRTDWIYQPLRRIRDDLMGEHSLHVIRAALDLLLQLGIIARRNNPGNGQDRTYQYQVQVDVVDCLGQSKLTDQSEIAEAREKTESGRVKIESPKFTVDKSGQQQPDSKIKSLQTNKPQLTVQREKKVVNLTLPPDLTEIEQTLLDELQHSQFPVTAGVKQIIHKKVKQLGGKALNRIRGAIAAVQEQLQRGNVKNLAGLLITAIAKGFTPNQHTLSGAAESRSRQESTGPRQDWMSSITAVTGYPDGVLCRQARDGTWLPIDGLAAIAEQVADPPHRELTAIEQDWLRLAVLLNYCTEAELDWNRPDDPEVELSQGYWQALTYQMKVLPLLDLQEEATLKGVLRSPTAHE